MIPVKNQLQLLVKNSELEISKDILTKAPKAGKDSKEAKDDEDEQKYPGMTRGVFIPTMNPSSKVLLYVKFKYRGVQKVVVYDHRSTEKLVLPHDVMDMS